MRLHFTLLAVLLAASSLPAWSATSGPVIRLFPTTVLEDIRETSEVAEEMENSLQEIIHRLDLQSKLYEESLCQGADADQGCTPVSPKQRKLYSFHGGIHPAEHKEDSNQEPIKQAALPPRLILPVQQHLGRPAKVIVSVGDKVLKGSTHRRSGWSHQCACSWRPARVP